MSAGWDFTTPVWDICEGSNYPKLVWFIAAGDFLCPDGVEFIDFSVLVMLSGMGIVIFLSLNDDVIDELDLEVFVGSWLLGV